MLWRKVKVEIWHKSEDISLLGQTTNKGRMDVIRKNKVKLIQWLRGDILILQHVQCEDLITQNEYEMVNSMQDPGGKITKLLDLLVNKGDGVCNNFLNLLKQNEVNESMPELRHWINSVNTVRPAFSPEVSGTNMSSSTPPAGSHGIRDCQLFLRKNRKALIQNITNAVEFTDGLETLTDGQRSKIQALPTDQEKMRMIIDYTNSKRAAQLLVNALFEHEADVMEELPKV